MKTIMAIVGAAGAVCFGTVLKAETRPVEPAMRFLVVPPMPAGNRQLIKGESAFDFPLQWRLGAKLSRDIQISADDRIANLHTDQTLAMTVLTFDDSSFGSSNSFCVPRLANATKGKWPLTNFVGPKILRSMTDGQFCLIDKDDDGSFDHSVLINAGSLVARTPKAIDSVAYAAINGAAVGEGDHLTIRYTGGRSFAMELFQQGRARQFESF